MIKALTQAQKDKFPEFREKWTKIGLCTDPANRREAEEAIRQSYILAGLVPPERIIWHDSPLSIIDAILEDKSLSGRAVNNSVNVSARDSAWRYINSSVDSSNSSVWNSIRDSAWRSVNNSVNNSVDNSVWNVGNSVREFIGSITLWSYVNNFCYGQHDAWRLSYFDYFREAVGLREETEKVTGLIEVARHAGWWMPYEKVCFVSERHNFLSLDERGRPHSLSGPAITYPDGWKIYVVHGVTVPGQLILDPQSQTIQEIDDERNVEVRRIRIERFGWLRYLRMIDAKTLDSRKNEVEGTNEALMVAPEGKILVCACPSTARIYALQVPQDVNSCQQAQNWLSGGLSKRVTAAT